MNRPHSTPRSFLSQPLVDAESRTQRPVSLRYALVTTDTHRGLAAEDGLQKPRPISHRPQSGRFRLVSMDGAVTGAGSTMMESTMLPSMLMLRDTAGGGDDEEEEEEGENEGEDGEGETPTRDRTMVAVLLILVTDVVATLQSTTLKVLRDQGFELFSLLLVSSVIGMAFSGGLMLVKGTPVRARHLPRDVALYRILPQRWLLMFSTH